MPNYNIKMEIYGSDPALTITSSNLESIVGDEGHYQMNS